MSHDDQRLTREEHQWNRSIARAAVTLYVASHLALLSGMYISRAQEVGYAQTNKEIAAYLDDIRRWEGPRRGFGPYE